MVRCDASSLDEALKGVFFGFDTFPDMDHRYDAHNNSKREDRSVMKKIGFIGALLASTALAACGGGGAEQDSDAQTAGEEMASGAETAAETVENAADETMDAAEDAADETMEAAEEATEDAGEAMSGDDRSDDAAEDETDAAQTDGETQEASAEGATESAGGAADNGEIVLAGLTGDPQAGRRIFVRCQTCHALEEGVHKNGPSLYGIFGRDAGSVEGYGRYSDANANSGITWTHETMFEYLENPRAYIPGTHMAFPGLPREQDRVDVIAYINENGGGAE